MPLSKRELEVARLVAAGLSNKEIGSRLFLSERTVETHVSKILNRLGINSRVEIASWVAQEPRTGLARLRLGGARLHDDTTSTTRAEGNNEISNRRRTSSRLAALTMHESRPSSGYGRC